MKVVNYLMILGLITVGMNSCSYDNEVELYPQAVECDTLNVGYSQTIASIMSANCNECHSGAAPSGNIVTDNYDDLKIIADNGRLWGAVNHESDFSPMPKDRPQLNSCNLSQIRIWLDNGALND